MPTDNEKERRFSMCINGEYREIKLPLIEMDETVEDTMDTGVGVGSQTNFGFDIGEVIPAKGLTKADLFLIIFCGLDENKLKQNNWRRLHGLPLKRKVKK